MTVAELQSKMSYGEYILWLAHIELTNAERSKG
jgi:hypothetical protein